MGDILSTLPLLRGFLWVGWDRRRRGRHDKLAGTLVFRVARQGPGTLVLDLPDIRPLRP